MTVNLKWLAKRTIYFRKHNFFFIFKFAFVHKRTSNRCVPKFQTFNNFIRRNCKKIIYAISSSASIPITHAQIRKCPVHTCSVFVKRIALKHHVFVKMKKSRIFWSLTGCASSNRNFNVNQRNRMIFRRKNCQSIFQIIFVQIFNWSFFCKTFLTNCKSRKQ